MFGFQAIAHYNGWTMAIAGALIVMAGLAVLSFTISLLPRVIAIFDRAATSAPAAGVVPGAETPFPDRCPADMNETASMVREATGPLGDPFALSDLYRACQVKDLPHPHLTIKSLREAGLLVSRGEGVFTWKS